MDIAVNGFHSLGIFPQNHDAISEHDPVLPEVAEVTSGVANISQCAADEQTMSGPSQYRLGTPEGNTGK
jgi:hypothetical protein